MIKFKIFYGNHTTVSADVKVNQWLEENPSVNLLSYRYQQVRMGDHSICIMYEEMDKNGQSTSLRSLREENPE